MSLVGAFIAGVLVTFVAQEFREAWRLHRLANQKRDEYASIAYYQGGEIRKIPFEDDPHFKDHHFGSM